MTKEEFIDETTNWDNHRELLWLGLENTTGPVVEFGSGDGSTPKLREYCKQKNRYFVSFDSNRDWAEKHDAFFVSDWDSVNLNDISLLFIDHAPGERRHIDMAKYSKIAKVIVIHDSEPQAPGYMLDKIWHFFPYRINTGSDKGAWTTLVSNFIDEQKLRAQL